DADLYASLPVPHFERGYILKALHLDAALAGAARMSITFDNRVAASLRVRQKRLPNLLPDVAPLVYEKALRIDMPAVGEMSWERVIELRESHEGTSFRSMIEQARKQVLEELPNLRTDADIREVVSDVMMADVIKELRGNASPIGSVLVGFSLNLLPVVGQLLH